MKITINQKAEERLSKGHPWIFRSDLIQVEKEQAGSASVYNPKGKLLGEALYSPKSLIALRMMTEGSERINKALLQARIEKAYRQRSKIFPNSNVYRLVFGEADALPSLIIDRYDDVVVFQSLSAGMETYKIDIIQILQNLLPLRSIIERNDASIREKEGLPLLTQAVFGEAPQELSIEIDQKKLSFDPFEGQKTGFFLDQRFNAHRAAQYAQGKVLDVFSYVGQFAVHAAEHAEEILCVDASASAIARVQKNAAFNQIINIKTQCENAFDYLKACDQQKKKFDTISLDPPAFVKNRSALKQALRGYKEINLRAMRLLEAGGILITSSCSQHLQNEVMENLLMECARDAKRHIQVLEKRGQPPDHPWLLSVPETNYLKCYILRIE